MARLLTGKEIVASQGAGLSERIATLAKHGITPALALVRIGDNPDDLSYERTAAKRAEGLGISLQRTQLPSDTEEAMLAHVIEMINNDDTIHGCLLFRPLPSSFDEERLCNMLAVEKDIDGISQGSLAAVFCDRKQGFPPATAAACLTMLDYYDIPLQGKHAVVVGRSLVVGKPLAMMLLARNASVTICHSKTENLSGLMRSADIVVCATGRARAFGAECFCEGQTVLDVGINFDAQGRLCGDVDFEAVQAVVSAITPVPGGLGSVTTSVTMEHVVQAAERSIAR